MKKLLLILLCLPMIGFGQIDTIDYKKFKTDITERENKLVSKWENDFSISQRQLVSMKYRSISEYDSLLNELYQILRIQLCEVQFRNLQKAQRAWLTYRDESLKLYKSQLRLNGQSTGDMSLSNMELVLYEIRVEELIDILQEIYFIKDGITYCNTKEYFIIK